MGVGLDLCDLVRALQSCQGVDVRDCEEALSELTLERYPVGKRSEVVA